MGWKRFVIDGILSAVVSFVVASVFETEKETEEVQQIIKDNQNVVIENTMIEEQKIPNHTYGLIAVIALLALVILYQWRCCCRRQEENKSEKGTELTWVTTESTTKNQNI